MSVVTAVLFTIYMTNADSKLIEFIKESKNGFDFAAVSSSSKIVNANRLQVHAQVYNIFNWFKRLALSAKNLLGFYWHE